MTKLNAALCLDTGAKKKKMENIFSNTKYLLYPYRNFCCLCTRWSARAVGCPPPRSAASPPTARAVVADDSAMTQRMAPLRKKNIYLCLYRNVRPVVAQRHKVWLWNRLVVGSIPTRGDKYLLKFIFPFLCSGVEVKWGVEFRLSTRDASRIRRKMGNEVS